MTHVPAPPLLRIAIDCKNLALYTGGIAAFFRPLLVAWLDRRPDIRFLLVGPAFDTADLSGFDNWEWVEVPWPVRLPGPMRHPVYDNLLFPRAIRRLAPDGVFSPYHDVRLPSPTTGIRSVMMIHDTCLAELGPIYPWRVRTYFLAMLRHNLAMASAVLTVSEASRRRIIALYGVEPERVRVVYNTLDAAFTRPANDTEVTALRARHGGAPLLFYAGGAEYRKNVGRLLDAVTVLADAGHNPRLLVTGEADAGWARVFEAHTGNRPPERLTFLGRLDLVQLKAHYAAADVVVFPSLCEGFGRLCLEAMATGTPLACSDLPVLREVAGAYPAYFDPLDPPGIAAAILAAYQQGRTTPVIDPRFLLHSVTESFLSTLDSLLW